MSKTKSKVASKNNPVTREQAKDFFFQGKKIKPVKLIGYESTFLAAEYDSTGDLVLGLDGKPISWRVARSIK